MGPARNLLLGTAIGLLWVGACADPLLLDVPPAPDGTGAGPTTVGVGGGGGGSPIGCISNTDCPEPTNVCDTIKGICVGCLVNSDCSQEPGTVCSQGTCICPGGGTWCGAAQCVDTMTSPEHCGSCGKQCFGACVDGACAEPWAPVRSEGAPSPRARHVAVWTESVMIVWGGTSTTSTADSLNDGAMYDPATNEWSPMTTVNAPTARQSAAAVWTGSEMLVWGGRADGSYLTTGGRFDPEANSWASMSTDGAPTGRFEHTAVWTGSEMIVYGGRDPVELGTGAAYDPESDSWTPIASTAESRTRHTAVWDGSQMLVVGGFGDIGVDLSNYWPALSVVAGRSYDPALDAWGELPTTGEPASRDRHSAVFDGETSKMVVFGGYGGDYESSAHPFVNDTWGVATGTPPMARREHSAVVVSDPPRMVVWGGRDQFEIFSDGGVLDLATDAWIGTVPSTITPRTEHTAISTGTEMIVWGGFNASNVALGDGALYTP